MIPNRKTSKALQEAWEEALSNPDYNYKCQPCGLRCVLDDEYQQVAPSWCDTCGTVTSHERLED